MEGRVAGAIAVFERFDGYESREETSSWLAGAKRMMLDRVEWIIMPDAATAQAALQNGEVDWWETPLADLVPALRRAPNVTVGITDLLGSVGAFRMNHLLPPFDRVEARRAVLMAMSQADYMHAIVGTDDALWKPMLGFFTPDTQFYSDRGGDILRKSDLGAAKRLIEKSGYDGSPVACLVAQDLAGVKEQGDVTADLLVRMGMKVDFVATDWGTVGARRASKKPQKEGSRNMFHTWHSGSDCLSPAGYYALGGNGEKAWFGWPTSPKTEGGITAWFEATDIAAEKAALARTNEAALDDVVYGVTGNFLSYQAWRSNVKGVRKGPMALFWGVTKEG